MNDFGYLMAVIAAIVIATCIITHYMERNYPE